ncbi:MAG: maltose ABC transporter permease MalF [Ardenticatenaceae bacterium]|nr:maltose ABC transporter permease MalF [Ardenticatenaceae bacterium]MCB9446516.1 maltose ABC transporter permease MalF [Ardenticatenaceae bacterium]
MSGLVLDKEKVTRSRGESPLARIVFIVLVVLFDIGAVWFIQNALSKGFLQLVIIIGIIAVMLNLIFLIPKAYPFRWMAVGLSFLILFTVYPIIFTVYVAFTNYGDGHLLTKEQALPLIQKATYLPEEGKSYSWTAFKSDSGEYALWLINSAGETFLGKPGVEIVPAKPGDSGIGEADSNGVPVSIEGYQRLNGLVAATDQELPKIKFGLEGDQTIQVRSPSEAAELEPLYKYDEATDTVIDQSNGDIYYNVDGTFTSRTGKTIKPGFRTVVGFKNFSDFMTSPALRGPLVRIVTWNFIFPTISVLSTFALGLTIAILFNDPDFPFKKIIRSFLLIPYTIPGLISIIMWRGMLNAEFGVVNRYLENWFGWAPAWTTEPIWAQVAILIVNLWLGYPYFMLITSGALQAIPSDIYEAATIDGATGWQSFRRITLPLLLVAVGPLLIASYVFNFNNFNLIYLFISGGPPIVGAATQAGHTDILISYVYKLAFESGGRGVQYGLASAISIIVFLIVGTITLVQYRFTNMWEEVSENV